MLWEFDNYTIYEETDMLRFENDDGEILGYVSKNEDMAEELNNGADPILDGWEDGIGNTITLEGWIA